MIPLLHAYEKTQHFLRLVQYDLRKKKIILRQNFERFS